jgi:RNA polymerase sigma-70 factor, ECF subfamily
MTSGLDETTAPLLDFGSLYRTHAPHLRRFALYLSGNAALADDLVSEAFVRAWTARARVELPTIRGYLFTIVRNLYLGHLRHQRRQAPLADSTIDDRPSPEVRARDRSELQTVLSALAALPEVDRAALLMRADDNLSYEEIAVALGISVSAARVKVHRARLKLAEVRLAGGGAAANGRGR